MEGVDHAQVVVLRKASSAVGVSLPEELTDPPCKTLSASAHARREYDPYSQHVEGRVRDQRSPDPASRNVSSRRLSYPSPGFGPFPDRRERHEVTVRILASSKVNVALRVLGHAEVGHREVRSGEGGGKTPRRDHRGGVERKGEHVCRRVRVG